MTHIVSQKEANIMEDIKAGVLFSDCLIKNNISNQSLLNICQRLTSLGILQKIKEKHYEVSCSSYEVLSTKAVAEARKKYKVKLFQSIPTDFPEEVVVYITGHYPHMSRKMLLQRLNDEGYSINKLELNVFIINNELDKMYKHKHEDVAS